MENARRFFSTDWSLASFEDGEMTAFVRTVPFAMRINGHGLSFGGVGPVVTMPQHRRKGHVGALLRRALEVMRERGQVLSGLHTPHPSLYRRFGWEIASEKRTYSFAPKDIELSAQPGERGRVRLLQPDDWSQADRVYRLHSAKRNGPIHRGEVWWRQAVFGTQPAAPVNADVALWENGRGEAQGYTVYYQSTRHDPDRPQFWVRELVALSTDAYLNLVLFLLRHDLPREIVWAAPPDDPFPHSSRTPASSPCARSTTSCSASSTWSRRCASGLLRKASGPCLSRSRSPTRPRPGTKAPGAFPSRTAQSKCRERATSRRRADLPPMYSTSIGCRGGRA
jgi:predicted acetyltransferase